MSVIKHAYLSNFDSVPDVAELVGIPVFHLNKLRNDKFGSLGKDLLEGLQLHGVVRLRDVLLNDFDIKDVLSLTREFFSLSLENKLSCAYQSGSSPLRGYSCVGQENLASVSGYTEGLDGDVDLKDVKETFDCGADNTDFANIWPKRDQSNLSIRLMSLFHQCERAVSDIHQILAFALNLPHDTFNILHSDRHHEMRLLHYPEIKGGDVKHNDIRTGDHTDFGSITVLIQDKTGGLQGRKPGSLDYFDVNNGHDEALLLLGDCFERWTGGMFFALPHRVQLNRVENFREGGHDIPERYSFAFFAKPNSSASVGNLDVEKFSRRRFQRMSFQEYNDLKLHRTYIHKLEK